MTSMHPRSPGWSTHVGPPNTDGRLVSEESNKREIVKDNSVIRIVSTRMSHEVRKTWDKDAAL